MQFKNLVIFICAGFYLLAPASTSKPTVQTQAPGSLAPFPSGYPRLANNANIPTKFLNVIHINDIYDVRMSPRCLEKMNLYTDANTLKLFSGDIIGPSIISDIKKGDQMIKIMETFKFDMSVLGNHEFDFTEEHFLEWNEKVNKALAAQQHQHVWLASNLKHVNDNINYKGASLKGKQAGDAMITATKTIDGQKICTFGLVDEFWISGSKIERSDFEYEDFKIAARRISRELRAQGCEFVFALTHMENKSDEELLADGISSTNPDGNDIDFVFGGHDHIFFIKKVGERVLLKSGMDFEQFSNLKMWWGQKLVDKSLYKGDYTVHLHKYTFLLDETVNGEKKSFLFSLDRPTKTDPNRTLNILIQRAQTTSADVKHTGLANYIRDEINPLIAEYLKPYIHIKNKLDARERHMFSGESYIMDFFADVGRAYYGAELGFVNVRMLKGEKIFHSDVYLRRLDFMRLFPYHEDKYVEVEMTGDEIVKLVTDAVPLIHQHTKRMIGVSGITFKYTQTGSGDDDHPVYNCALIENTLRINGQAVEKARKYRVVLISSLINPKVGFASTINKPILTAEQHKIEPIQVFDYLGTLFDTKQAEMLAEFNALKTGPCKEAKLHEFFGIQPKATLLDSLDKIKGATSCQDLLSQANPEALRRARLFSLAEPAPKTPYSRVVLSYPIAVEPRFTPQNRLIL